MENSMRGVFSISSANFSSPIAESTHLNGSSLHTKFNWGEGAITSRSRNSSLTRNNKTTNNTSGITGTPPKVTMSPSSAHIDARTYVDIHSNGLASRIVKYHDNSARLNRSLSLGNLYNKPGQFPVVHLKKNETQFKAKKSRNLSMTRIAAPEKSVFHGNTLSSILRSGSVVGLQKTDEEISRENRPILHPPPTESELAPTRSVLEVLKEISRKRINSDDIDGTELIKKHCKELDAVTTYNSQKTVQSKRQREGGAMTPNTQVSPEQQAVKKRMCNYNNDIMSSLSSSMLNMSKKKFYNTEVQSPTNSGFKQTHILNVTSTAPNSLRDENTLGCASLDLENFVQSKYTPLTPLPSTPNQVPSECVVQDKSVAVSRRASEPVISTSKPKLTLFNKNYDNPPSEVQNDIPEPKDNGDVSGIQFVKPKKSSSLSSGGTLLIEKTKKSKLALMLSGLKGELNEDDEVDAPQKEEKSEQAPTTVPSSTTSTALSTSVAISFETTTTTSTTPITLPSVTSTLVPKAAAETANPMKPKESTPISFGLTGTTEFKISTTSSTATSTSSTPAIVSSASTTTSPILKPSSNTNAIPTFGGFNFGQTKPLSLPTATTAPAVFLPPTNLITTQPAQPSVSSAAAVVPIAAATTTEAPKPFTFGSLTTQSATSTTPAFTFGSSQSIAGIKPLPNSSAIAQTTTTTASVTTSNNPPPIFGQSSASTQPTFSFGSLAESKPNTTTNSLTSITSVPAITAPPAFNFGAAKTTWDQSTTSAPVNSVIPAPKATFTGIATTSAPQPAPPTTTSIGGFSFGGTLSAEAPKPLFGSTAPATTNQTQANPTNTFSFSATKPPNAQTNATTPFTFGSPATSSTVATNPTQPPPVFGSTTPVKPANSFSFSTAAPAAPLKASFSFSTADKSAAPSTSTSSSIGGFSFNAPATSSLSAADSSKNLFAAAAVTTTAPNKPVFNFGTSSTSQTAAKPNVFGAPATTTTNLFGPPATTTAQSSPFTFGSSASTNNPVATTKPSMNSIFGATASAAATSSTTSTNSIFGGQSTTAVAPQPSSSTFNFGASSSNSADNNKPAGGFVFGSSSSIGSNVSKPATDMKKTFVFGDGSTTITPAPAPTTNLFGGSNAATSANSGGSDNKLFSFGGVTAATTAANNAFGANRQVVNQSPVFNFGAPSSAPAAQAPAPANLFAPQPGETQSSMPDRPIRKAMRRLHKT